MTKKECWIRGRVGTTYSHDRIVTHAWIKRQIAKTYSNGDSETNMRRELIITESNSNYGELGYIMYALNGSPPKGCAIYSPEHKYITIIDAWGEKKITHNNIYEVVDENLKEMVENESRTKK